MLLYIQLIILYSYYYDRFTPYHVSEPDDDEESGECELSDNAITHESSANTTESTVDMEHAKSVLRSIIIKLTDFDDITALMTAAAHIAKEVCNV